MLRLVCLALILFLAGCAPAVMLKNEQTGQIARCEGIGFFTWGGAFKHGDYEECIRSWEQQGFKRTP